MVVTRRLSFLCSFRKRYWVLDEELLVCTTLFILKLANYAPIRDIQDLTAERSRYFDTKSIQL